jgi:hypothetical protein
MSRFFSNRFIRLQLVFSVSIWMAGGCLFGCSNGVLAADVVDESVPTIEAGESCNAMQSHHCCAAVKTRKKVVHNARQPTALPAFLPAPRDAMNDCPLAMNATAVTSKNSTQGSDSGHTPAADLPSFEKQTLPADNISVVSFLPNRGPTHLRCCVFLI